MKRPANRLWSNIVRFPPTSRSCAIRGGPDAAGSAATAQRHPPPADPLWWPPAPGWWLLAVLASPVSLRIRFLHQACERQATHQTSAQSLSGSPFPVRKGGDRCPYFLHEANELLKRLFIHGLHDDRRGKPTTQPGWLLLDERSDSTSFSEGPGAATGQSAIQTATRGGPGNPASDPDQPAREGTPMIEWLWPWMFALAPLPSSFAGCSLRWNASRRRLPFRTSRRFKVDEERRQAERAKGACPGVRFCSG